MAILQPERLQLILSLCDTHGFVTNAQLMDACNASKSTIHRDLEELEKDKLLTRTRGGAVSLKKGTTYEPPLLLRRVTFAEEKQRIANEAMRYIHVRDTVLLDSGTTIHELGKLLVKFKNLMVATNDVNIAYDLSFNPDIDLIVTGGIVRKGCHTLVGCFGESIIEQLHADRIFLSVDAVDINHGCMCYSVDEMQIKRAMLHAAKEVILLCDHSKFETVAFVNVCKLSAVDIIITGKDLDEKYVSQIKLMNIELIQV
jgi:DeoR/GlpR family transcriptional regulator of sugar metabolism